MKHIHLKICLLLTVILIPVSCVLGKIQEAIVLPSTEIKLSSGTKKKSQVKQTNSKEKKVKKKQKVKKSIDDGETKSHTKQSEAKEKNHKKLLWTLQKSPVLHAENIKAYIKEKSNDELYVV